MRCVGSGARCSRNARCTQVRKTTHSLDGQHQDADRTPHGEESIGMTEDRDKLRKYVHGVWPTLADRGRLKNRTAGADKQADTDTMRVVQCSVDTVIFYTFLEASPVAAASEVAH